MYGPGTDPGSHQRWKTVELIDWLPIMLVTEILPNSATTFALSKCPQFACASFQTPASNTSVISRFPHPPSVHHSRHQTSDVRNRNTLGAMRFSPR